MGIGPEIIRGSLLEYNPGCATIIIGEQEFYPDRSIPVISHLEDVTDSCVYFYRAPELKNGNTDDPSYNYVRTGIDLALDRKVNALVTGPISKEKWRNAGITFKGHTELLAQTAGVKNHCMFFWSENLKNALFTVHIPLKEVFRHIHKEKIVDFTRFIDSELSKLFKKKFLFLVSGLNPHAGENGIMGDEEIESIIPAIESLKSEILIDGPFPPDTIFLKARDTKDSVVISWYHDQGLIAFKLSNFHSGVNMTLGLPYIRTSPDHGTAFDIAGKGIADPSSMMQAIKLADFLVGNSTDD
jgi:4-hydroxythreonine-4-phosphate dehydrogenase